MSPSTLLGRGFAVAVLPMLAVGAAADEWPHMQFDTGHAAACRVLSGDDVPDPGPGEKVIEATFRVSMLQRSGDDAGLEHVLIEIVSPRRRLRVLQLNPQTELSTEYEGPIAREETTTRTKSFDAGIHGNVTGPTGLADVKIQPNLGGGASRAETVKETARRLPPKIAAVTAGTINGQHGAFFKLTPNSQSILEGQRTFTCRFAVPVDWRADWAVVRCRALCRRDDLFGNDKIESCGGAEFYVGLYLHDDAEAKAAADALAHISIIAQSADNPTRPLGGALHGARRWLCSKPVVEESAEELEEAAAELASLSGTRPLPDAAEQTPPIPTAED